MFAGDFVGSINEMILDGDLEIKVQGRNKKRGTPHRSHRVHRKRPWSTGPFSSQNTYSLLGAYPMVQGAP